MKTSPMKIVKKDEFIHFNLFNNVNYHGLKPDVRKL